MSELNLWESLAGKVGKRANLQKYFSDFSVSRFLEELNFIIGFRWSFVLALIVLVVIISTKYLNGIPAADMWR